MTTDATASTPNVVLVTVDSLRADAVYGDEVETPAHDRLRSEGCTYTSAFAQGPFTTFSMPSLFTARYPGDLDYYELTDRTVGVKVGDRPTLPSVLRSAGYDTAGFHSNPLLSHLFDFDRGFDVFDAHLPLSVEERFPDWLQVVADKVRRVVRRYPYVPADRLNEQAIDWLDGRDGDAPFFLWLHYMDVHGPYQSHSGNAYLNKFEGERLWRTAVKRPEAVGPDDRERLRALYRKEVAYTDRQLDGLLTTLEDRGLLADSVVALTADHGEAFGEHGKYSHPHHLYDELLHVPLILRGPEIDSGAVEAIVELSDVAPTITAACDVDAPSLWEDRRLPTSDGDADEDPLAFSEANLAPDRTRAVRTGRWKYIVDDVRGQESLFDLVDDPGERRNVVEEHEDVRDRLATAVADRTTSSGDASADRETVDDPGVRGRLSDLGYLDE